MNRFFAHSLSVVLHLFIEKTPAIIVRYPWNAPRTLNFISFHDAPLIAALVVDLKKNYNLIVLCVSLPPFSLKYLKRTLYLNPAITPPDLS